MITALFVCLLQISSLGYINRAPTEEPERRGVVLWERESAYEGFNLYSSRTRPNAALLDMAGEPRHTWHTRGDTIPFHHVELAPDGVLYVIRKYEDVLKLARDSRVLWRHECRAHHDLYVHEDTVFVLVQKDSNGVLLDDVVALDAETGEFLRRWDLWHLTRLFTYETKRDMMHTNTLTRTADGDFLICMREQDTVALVDLYEDHLEWGFGITTLDRPHSPALLADGMLMVLDNGRRRGWSRVVVLDPFEPLRRKLNRPPGTMGVELEINALWEYRAEDFFTSIGGGCQPLPNGNVLITDYDRGRAFEVTPAGNVVWDFWNPDVVDGERAALNPMVRVPR